MDKICGLLETRLKTNCWLVIISIGLMILFIISKEDGGYFVNVVSVGSAITSIVLAIMAIYYSFKSNEKFDASLSYLSEITNKIVNNVQYVKTGIDNLILNSTITPTEARNIKDSNSIDTMRARLNSLGEFIGFYIIALSQDTKNHKFNLKMLFKDDPALYYYIAGILHVIANNSLHDVTMSYRGLRFQIHDFGKLDSKYFLNADVDDKDWPRIKEMIEDYFGYIPDDHEQDVQE